MAKHCAIHTPFISNDPISSIKLVLLSVLQMKKLKIEEIKYFVHGYTAHKNSNQAETGLAQW